MRPAGLMIVIIVVVMIEDLLFTGHCIFIILKAGITHVILQMKKLGLKTLNDLPPINR